MALTRHAQGPGMRSVAAWGCQNIPNADFLGHVEDLALTTATLGHAFSLSAAHLDCLQSVHFRVPNHTTWTGTNKAPDVRACDICS